MRRWSLLMLGLLLAAIGGTWFLQGIGILPGSFMSGSGFWAGAGLGALGLGAAALYRAWRGA